MILEVMLDLRPAPRVGDMGAIGLVVPAESDSELGVMAGWGRGFNAPAPLASAASTSVPSWVCLTPANTLTRPLIASTVAARLLFSCWRDFRLARISWSIPASPPALGVAAPFMVFDMYPSSPEFLVSEVLDCQLVMFETVGFDLLEECQEVVIEPLKAETRPV